MFCFQKLFFQHLKHQTFIYCLVLNIFTSWPSLTFFIRCWGGYDFVYTDTRFDEQHYHQATLSYWKGHTMSQSQTDRVDQPCTLIMIIFTCAAETPRLYIQSQKTHGRRCLYRLNVTLIEPLDSTLLCWLHVLTDWIFFRSSQAAPLFTFMRFFAKQTRRRGKKSALKYQAMAVMVTHIPVWLSNWLQALDTNFQAAIKPLTAVQKVSQQLPKTALIDDHNGVAMLIVSVDLLFIKVVFF